MGGPRRPSLLTRVHGFNRESGRTSTLLSQRCSPTAPTHLTCVRGPCAALSRRPLPLTSPLLSVQVPGFSVERIRSEPKGFGGKALQVYQLLKRAAVLGGPLAVEEVIKEVKTTPGWECVASLPVMQDLSCGRRSKRFLVALWSEGRSRRHTARPSRATGTVWLKIHKELPRAALAEVIQQSFSRQTAQSEVPIGPPPRSVESNNGVVTVSDEWVCDGCASVNAGDLAVCVFCGVMR